MVWERVVATAARAAERLVASWAAAGRIVSRGDGSGGGEGSSEGDSVVAGGGSKDKGDGVSVTRAAVRVAAAKAATVATEKTARVAERAGAGLARVALAARAVAI